MMALLTRVRTTLLLVFLSSAAAAQTLTLNNDIQTHATLINTTVSVNGRSELRITGTGNPISGSTLLLTGPDAWLRFTALRPSAVNSALLGQIRIDGANAVLNTNCRIAQFGDGAVVIPHGSGFRPLELFDGPSFTGESSTLLPYFAYNDGNFGLANRVSSFRLKRGYTLTIAQNANGTGMSKNYVAQDGDLDVALLPADLNDAVSFIRVFPWRWTTKKGIGGNIESGLNVSWGYNWNIDRNSALDWEYVPIRQNRWWPSLSQNWQTRGANHLLGYNEPDSADQANIAVADAIWSWPDLLGSGLRLGSPAPTDGGLNWLYSFTDQADAAKLRIDFTAVHYYRCFNPADPAGAASQMYNFLKAVHDRTKRPIWVTEWNNGANWTGCGDPSFEQQALAIQAMMDMMEAAPFVERYALFNWVEDVRRVKWDDGGLTTAGVVYRGKASALSHTQTLPEVNTTPSAFYQFENDARDSSANGHTAITRGSAKFATGKTKRGLSMSGIAANGDHVLLPPRLGDSGDFTFGAWVYWNGGANWQRIIDLGAGTNNYLFLTPSAGGSNQVRFAIKNGATEQQLNHSAPLPTNTWTHVAVTLSGNSGKLFINGNPVATNNAMTLNPVDLGTTTNYLGKSQFAADPLFAGLLDEVQILSHALTDTQVLAMATNTPPQFTSATIDGGTASQGIPYSGTLAGSATDPGDTLTYSKLSGPNWLIVAAGGSLSGTPPLDDEGPQQFIIVATDSAGASAVAQLNITLPVTQGNGTWASDSDGNWSDTTKWSANFRANGEGRTAFFSTLNISSDRSVQLDSDRTIGSMVFGDSSGAQSWNLSSPGNQTLTLAASAPGIAVNQNTATLAIALHGNAGLNKTGAGTLILAGNSSVKGTLNIDSASTSVHEGTVRLAHPGAATGFSTLQIRTNNSGSSTLELEGSSGPILSSAAISLSGRNGNIPAIRNLAGANILAGTLSVQSGGTNYRIESNSGQLELAGSATSAAGVAITSAAGETRNITLQGSGNGRVSGRITNGSASTLNLLKSGGGKWTLDAGNSYTGTTSISQGELELNGSTGSGATTVSSGATLSGSGTVGAALTAQTGSTVRIGTTSFPMVESITLLDDFESYTTGATTAATGGTWNGEFIGTANSNIVSSGGGLALQTKGGAAWRGGETDLTRWNAGIGIGDTATIFFQMKAVGAGFYDIMTGLSPSLANIDITNAYQDFAVMPWVNGTAGSNLAYKMADAGLAGDQIFPMSTDVWYNIWLVVDNAAQRYSVYWSTGTANGTLGGTASTYRNAFTNTALNALAFMANGNASTSLLVDNIHRMHGINTTYPIGKTGISVPAAESLRVLNGFTLASGATLDFKISSGPVHDKLRVGGLFIANGTLKVTLDPQQAAPTTGGSFDLFDAASSSINFANFNLPALPPGLAWDSSGISSGVISITGTPLPTYQTWASAHAFPPGSDGPSADADLDGTVNLLEWLFGGDPLRSSTATLPIGRLRTLTGGEFPGAVPSEQCMSLTAIVRKSTPGWSCIAQAASSPAALDAPGSSTQIVSVLRKDLGEFEEREWFYTVPVEEARTGFMRLKLTEN
jgi:autotransporter-associated beta strand protein